MIEIVRFCLKKGLNAEKPRLMRCDLLVEGQSDNSFNSTVFKSLGKGLIFGESIEL